MDTDLLKRKFERLGARLKVGAAGKGRWEIPPAIRLDIRTDRHGEYFELLYHEPQVLNIDALDVQANQRHLLLLAWTRQYIQQAPRQIRRGIWRDEADLPPLAAKVEKPRFLCGHDERHWFVAAVPEDAHASTVRTAMEALKPTAVLAAQASKGISFRDRFLRKNRAFRRQGEWFFLPEPDLVVPASAVRRHEPLQRSGGKAHWADEGYRLGGEAVYVSSQFPSGLTEAKFREHILSHPGDRREFRIMQRNAILFVRGRITHPDHAVITLNCWHRVGMNTENRAKARANVVFLD